MSGDFTPLGPSPHVSCFLHLSFFPIMYFPIFVTNICPFLQKGKKKIIVIYNFEFFYLFFLNMKSSWDIPFDPKKKGK